MSVSGSCTPALAAGPYKLAPARHESSALAGAPLSCPEARPPDACVYVVVSRGSSHYRADLPHTISHTPPTLSAGCANPIPIVALGIGLDVAASPQERMGPLGGACFVCARSFAPALLLCCLDLA